LTQERQRIQHSLTRRVSEDKPSSIKSDPNRADDPEYIVRLVGRVSIETVKIVNNLPPFEPQA
jgi:predicted helicase